MSQQNTKVTLIRGDGIGPEISEAVVRILEAAQAPIQFEEQEAGLCSIEKYGVGITDECLQSIARNKIALKGPTTTPVGGGHKSINVTVRKALDLYVNLRPVKSVPGIETPFKNIDLLIVRENIEDTYGGIEHRQSEDVAQCLRLITRSGSLRAAQFAFELARKQKRRKVTAVHKANIMKITDGMFLNAFREVATHYPDIEANDIIIDNCCMQLVSKPQQFDVLLLPNLFGDIVSDLCAGLIGGLGIASGANIGQNCAVFEAVHGSAPDIAGRGLANPTAMLFSALSMLRYLEKFQIADQIENAVFEVLKSGRVRTGDLGGKATTQEFTHAVIQNL
jgi:NAD-dependent isocitrate dehydrogenase